MNIVQGNILDCTEDIIVHQTNCMGVMGSGLAKQIKEKYPEVFKGYYYYCKNNLPAKFFGKCLICHANDGKHIANVFGQGLQTDYKKLKSGLREVRNFAKKKNLSVAIPYKIGCGLAGGDWEIVSKIIEKLFKDVQYKIYRLD